MLNYLLYILYPFILICPPQTLIDIGLWYSAPGSASVDCFQAALDSARGASTYRSATYTATAMIPIAAKNAVS